MHVKLITEGGGGLKITKKVYYVICERPLTACTAKFKSFILVKILEKKNISTSGFGHPVTIQISAAYIIQLTEHTFIVAVFEVAAVLRFFVITVTDTTL